MTAGRPAGLRYYDDYTGLRAPGEQARLAAYAEFFNNMNAEFFGGGAQTLLARYDRDWRSPRFHCEHSTVTTLHDGGHYTARRRSLPCTTRHCAEQPGRRRGLYVRGSTTTPTRMEGFHSSSSPSPTRLHEYVGVHVVGLNLAVDRMHAWVQWWNNSSAHSNAEHYLWLPIRARLVPTRRTSRVNMDNMDKMDKVTGMRQHVGTATR